MTLIKAFPLLLLAAAAWHSHAQADTDPRLCTIIVSAVERLACFDAAAGTPPAPTPVRPAAAAAAAAAAPITAGRPVPNASPDVSIAAVSSQRPLASAFTATRSSDLVRQNESARQPQDTAFLLSYTDDEQPGQQRVMISAPALGAGPPIYLAISCLSNISRLQLLAEQPFPQHHINIRLYMDDRPLSAGKPWRVLDEGNVADAGRGLVAIEHLRPFVAGTHLRVESDYAPLNGLTFDATGLQTLLARQREACHW
ncbi:type VI secretion system-associated protein TagO [Achromobacter seleniivolatilans]|uniref:Type VI secretion system-associated protein TagO n=1 Tax=Achromobacter seleniivolatilans TaxID=3047478 RepID=A0ABY9M2J4_9BURK|nr:type VI secretion system-associated protein TagO [Achromobacter sp. R39]WMD21231.1 type VI secretion system-associated protein TagO [Achromobacter sp. R39]